MPRADSDNTILRPDWLDIEIWPFRVRTAALGGTRIAYTDEGAGPTILLVHDGLCSYLWGQLIERLVHRFRVVTLDFPGSGLSPASAEPISLENDARLLDRFVSTMGLRSFTLAVHDLGGPVGLGMAMRSPERVDGLLLINTFAWPPQTAALRTMLGVIGSRPMAALNATSGLLFRATSGRFGIGRHLDSPGRGAFLGLLADRGPRRRFHDLIASVGAESRFLEDVEGALDSFRDRPVLTVFGERNDPFGFQERWQQHFPAMERLVIRGGYHFPMCDAPDVVADRIDRWHRERVTVSRSPRADIPAPEALGFRSWGV